MTIYLETTFQSDPTFMALLIGALWAFVATWRRPGLLHSLALG